MLWLPAAIGGHRDHLDVRDALLPLAQELPPARVRVYADLPYAAEAGYAAPARRSLQRCPACAPADAHLRAPPGSASS